MPVLTNEKKATVLSLVDAARLNLIAQNTKFKHPDTIELTDDNTRLFDAARLVLYVLFTNAYVILADAELTDEIRYATNDLLDGRVPFDRYLTSIAIAIDETNSTDSTHDVDAIVQALTETYESLVPLVEFVSKFAKYLDSGTVKE